MKLTGTLIMVGIMCMRTNPCNFATVLLFLPLIWEAADSTNLHLEEGLFYASTSLEGILARARDNDVKDWTLDIRRKLHANPELMFEEKETNALICKKLDELGIRYDSPVGGTGVVATLGKREGPSVALRADMDALPLDELADVSFRSKVPGKMHACGHDAHVAMLLGAARLLKEREDTIEGKVILIFQPAEEGGAGGRIMRDAGALGDASAVFGLHVDPMRPTGVVASRPGLYLGADSCFEITITGQGAHGAMPQFSHDPVVAAAMTIVALQTLVAREMDPLDSGVVSVTRLQAGAAYNIIPERVTIGGTMRSLSREGIVLLKRRLTEVAQGQAAVHGCNATVDFLESEQPPYPPTINDEGLYNFFADVGRKLLGGEREDPVILDVPTLAVEDFSFYQEAVKGLFISIGTRNETKGSVHGLHSPFFLLDEDTLPIGAALHTALALEFLARETTPSLRTTV